MINIHIMSKNSSQNLSSLDSFSLFMLDAQKPAYLVNMVICCLNIISGVTFTLVACRGKKMKQHTSPFIIDHILMELLATIAYLVLSCYHVACMLTGRNYIEFNTEII